MTEPVLAWILLLFRGKYQDHQTQMMPTHQMMNTVTEVKPNAVKARGKQNHSTGKWERQVIRKLQSGIWQAQKGEIPQMIEKHSQKPETPKHPLPGSYRDQWDIWQGKGRDAGGVGTENCVIEPVKRRSLPLGARQESLDFNFLENED